MTFKRLLALLCAILTVITVLPLNVIAEEADGIKIMPADWVMRRPLSPEQPMWIVHIDTWNNADPDKIIDLIPEDILPYVVFNISLSINWNSETNSWGTVQYGYETAKSWLRTCAERQVWAMIQPASGGQCHFPDYPYPTDLEDTLFGEFFKEYPNFLGFNYCEQFWGFEQEDFPVTCPERYSHFANLLELCNRYGGYLVVSWCGNQWGQSINPMGMLKQVPEWEEACRLYPENFILCEKYTQESYLYDQQSLVLGSYLSGYSGHYGIRYDETSWTGKLPYAMSTGLAAQLERLLLSGVTVIDGPELVTVDDFFEDRAITDDDGYNIRQWGSYVQFKNVAIDMFRKVIDGTVRIPSREEVIENTKVVIIQDVNTGSDDDKYCSYPTLFDGLYKMDDTGSLRDNKTFYKKTGRYPAIPTVYALADDLANTFEVQINQSEIKTRWKTIDDKVNEFNELFPEESTGEIYAGRKENTWVVYNPLKTGQDATGSIGFKYNTAKGMEMTLSAYTTGIISEYSDSLDIYLNNFEEGSMLMTKKDILTITGCTSEPEVTYSDRGVENLASKVTTEYFDGTLTVTVAHNGPVELKISAKGNETDRLTEYQPAKLVAPERPGIYYGDRQYEIELSDQKGVERNVANGCNSGVFNYVGQGYTIFGNAKGSAVRDTVNVLESGVYMLNLRYSLTNSDVSKLALYVNGKKVSNLELTKTGSVNDWAFCEQEITLKQGANTVELKATGELEDKLYLDCIIIGGDCLGAASASSNGIVIAVIVAVIALALVAVLAVVLGKKKA